jgi:hypothetical protein
MAAAAVATTQQPDIHYTPDLANYEARVKRRRETEILATKLPVGFPLQLTSDLVWDGASIGDSFDWNFVFTASHIDELEVALAHFKCKPSRHILLTKLRVHAYLLSVKQASGLY